MHSGKRLNPLKEKTDSYSRIRQYPDRIRDLFLAFAGILLFAGFIHNPFPGRLIAIGGLLGTAAVIAFVTRHRSLGEVFGFGPWSRRTLIFSIVAVGLGMLLGIWTRTRFELTMVPEGFTGMAVVAPLVGAAEELVFRGFIQGHLRPAGRILAIASAATMHTSYKLLVILTLAAPLQFDLFFLIFWTFSGGLLFGIIRERSGHVVPPLIAHAVFDIVLYGALHSPPVWVWS